MGRNPFSRFVLEQWGANPELEKQDLSGQTVLIVGASVGLGLEAAKHLAKMGPGKLVLACRSIQKAEDAARGTRSKRGCILDISLTGPSEIQKATGFDRTGAYVVDLSLFSSVNAFVDEFESKEERLDILIYNAAVWLDEYRATSDGFEET